ncbi:MAG: efflux RND transporter periplasmic adaptor subunit, partial [Deltaproteobacteria bacterium]|nr:efflux RND transporter periplasmic adaptor subunit [Deltaproteobacteria bacterium]
MDETTNEQTVDYRHDAMKGVKFMSVLRWTLFASLLIIAAVVLLRFFGVIGGGEKGDAVYHCPMHPTYISSQPGDCPICGMTLVPISGDEEKQPVGAESLPRESSKGETQNPKDSSPPAKDSEKKYTCPMHPEVVSDKPGKCPKCGMNLESVEEGKTDEKKTEKKEVPGLVNIHLTPGRIQLIGVMTGKAVRKEFSSGISVYGFVEKNERNSAKVHLRFSGWIQKLHANAAGDYVKKGAPLLTIYSQELYQTEQEMLLLMKSSDGKSPFPQSGDLLDAAKKKLRLLGVPEGEISRLEKSPTASESLTIVSPISGYVTKKGVLEGAFVMPETELFEISDLSSVWVIGKVFEKDIPRVKTGMQVVFRADAVPGNTFSGEIEYIYPELEKEVRAAKARVVVKNEGLVLKPGMYGKIEVA